MTLFKLDLIYRCGLLACKEARLLIKAEMVAAGRRLRPSWLTERCYFPLIHLINWSPLPERISPPCTSHFLHLYHQRKQRGARCQLCLELVKQSLQQHYRRHVSPTPAAPYKEIIRLGCESIYCWGCKSFGQLSGFIRGINVNAHLPILGHYTCMQEHWAQIQSAHQTIWPKPGVCNL